MNKEKICQEVINRNTLTSKSEILYLSKQSKKQ